jgi:ATP-dependent helicase Lhr and Lhr-like helicase
MYKAVGLSLGNDFKADELTLWSNVTIDWAGIGDTPEAFEAVFPSLFEVSSDLSIYQSMLPLELQLREFLQIWLKDETVRKALLRLRASTSVAVHPGFLTGAVLSK